MAKKPDTVLSWLQRNRDASTDRRPFWQEGIDQYFRGDVFGWANDNNLALPKSN